MDCSCGHVAAQWPLRLLERPGTGHQRSVARSLHPLRERAKCPRTARANRPPSPETYGPAAPGSPPGADERSGTPGIDSGQVYGPPPTQLRPVTLVFGPAMARAYADVGVLRALIRRNVPITSIYGGGVGALIAALYAMDPNLNHFEWAILKFRDDIFAENGKMLHQFFQSTGDDGSRLEDALNQVFGAKDIRDSKIPLKIVIQVQGSRLPTLVSQGPLVAVLRAALSAPGVFQPPSWEGRPAQAALGPTIAGFLCDDAKATGGNPVVLVDAQSHTDQVRNADLVIRPDLSGLTEQDYAKKTDAAYRGKRAAEGKMAEIQRWVGLARAGQE